MALPRKLKHLNFSFTAHDGSIQFYGLFSQLVAHVRILLMKYWRGCPRR